jgi:hypothetical protein
MALANFISFRNARFVRAAALAVLSLTALAFASSAPPIPAAANPSLATSADSHSSPKTAGSLAPLIAGDDKWAPGSGVRGVNGAVRAFAVDGDGNLYVGGYFNLAGSVPVRSVAKWDGSNWHALAYGLDDGVRALAWDTVHGWLYAGGDFTNICLNAGCSIKNPSRGIARWDPSGGGSWHALDYGLGGGVYALALDSIGNLYAGGSFSTICYSADCLGSLPANNVAKWNPAGAGIWSALSSSGGNGVSGGDVYALAWWNAPLIGEVLVVGGAFTNAGGTPMNHLAYWSPGSPGSWSSFVSGVDGVVYALAVDWSTSSVVVGGGFFDICELGAIPPACGTPIRVNNVALLAPAAYYWGPLNYGVYGTVYNVSIDIYHKSVYVGGYLWGYCNAVLCGQGTSTPASYIARWDYSAGLPGSWSTLGKGTDDGVSALAYNVMAGLVYVGGSFFQAGSVPTDFLAAWDGSAWSSVGTGDGLSQIVYAAAADANGRVYVGGHFRSVGNVFVNRIAVWNSKTGTWSPLGYGVYGDVYALTLDSSGNLYVAGAFTFICGNAECSVMGQRVNGIAKWTPNPSGGTGTWSPLGAGVYGGIRALAFDHNNKLYAGGDFTGICESSACSSPVPANFVAVWNGSNWSNLGLGVNYTVWALAVDKDDNLYAGGDFYRLCSVQNCLSGQTANHIARWTPGGSGTWSTVGNGVDRSVLGLVVDRNNTLFAGGGFGFICSSPACTSNTQAASGIAKWNGSWSSVGSGLNGGVRVLRLDEWNHLFAGGFFQSVCADPDCYGAGATVNGIAQWDGTGWSALGSGVGPMPGSAVYALTYSHGTLFVGGYFGTAGDKVSANFARYTYGKYTYVPLVLR